MAAASPSLCSWPLPSLSALLSPSLRRVCGLRPVGKFAGETLPLATADETEGKSLSASSVASLVVLGSRTIVRLALGSWGCSSPLVTDLLEGTEPSPLFTPIGSIVALSHAGLFFRQRLTPRSVFPLLRLDWLWVGDEGGWGWSCGCVEGSLGFSDDSRTTDGFVSFLLSVGNTSFFLLDYNRQNHNAHLIKVRLR